MREILFKAKLKTNDRWIEGFYCSMRETTYCIKEDYDRNPVPIHHCIAVNEMTDWGLPNKLRLYEVDPETICQFTGLCDKYGNKIWENDIVKTASDIYAQVKSGLYTTGFALEECNQGFYVDFSDETYLRHELGYWNNKVEVRGNIFDNPELLQEESDE